MDEIIIKFDHADVAWLRQVFNLHPEASVDSVKFEMARAHPSAQNLIGSLVSRRVR